MVDIFSEKSIKEFKENHLRCSVGQARAFLGFSWKALQRATGATDGDISSWMKGEKPSPIFERIILLLVKKMEEMIRDYGMALPSWDDYLKGIKDKAE
jgi:hypothetical protein